MSHQTTAWLVPSAASPGQSSRRPAEIRELPAWLTIGLLALASSLLLALASASAWLSYHAQVAYVLAHNGDQIAAARVWALLLDAGTAGVSLLRLYETLRRRSGLTTRASLLGCITASVTMNILHAPSHAAGGYLVAAVPPVMYAVFLEHLLTNLRSLLIADDQRRTVWRTLALWVNFPALMWSGQRGLLRRDAEGDAAALEVPARGDADAQRLSLDGGGEAEHVGRRTDAAHAPRARDRRQGRGPGAKRVAFEAALADQVRSGDLRLFSADERERNAAAYQAAASLPAPLSQGAARRYVVQALPRLGNAGRPGDGLPLTVLRTTD